MEFNQVAMANSEGSEVMLNRVMTKDNIGVAVLLEVNNDIFVGGTTMLLCHHHSRIVSMHGTGLIFVVTQKWKINMKRWWNA